MDVLAALKNGTATIVDVRSREEFQSGHVAGSINIPLQEVPTKVEEFKNMPKPLVLCCLSGGRSRAAADKMRKKGFINVYELTGGTMAWRAANKALEGNSTDKQMTLEEFNAGIVASKTVLVDFGAAWCAPCRQMEPVLKNLTDNNKDKFTLLKVDGGKDHDILNAYKVTALPVFIIFKDGKPIWRRDGIATEKEMADLLN